VCESIFASDPRSVRRNFVFIFKRLLVLLYYRESYYLDGFVVSDCDAIDTIMHGHRFTSTVEDTVAVALHAGTDLDCGSFYAQHTHAALDNKTIVEADIDQALERTFNVLVRLGYFDPPEQQPYRQISRADVDTLASRQLALEAAQQSIVLLKNLNKALPLDINQLKNKKIALIGPTANATYLLLGNYYGRPPYLIDPVSAFENVTQGHSMTVAIDDLFILIYRLIPNIQVLIVQLEQSLLLSIK
jgi:beta-glucosidase-like glycosyl hydrolase